MSETKLNSIAVVHFEEDLELDIEELLNFQKSIAESLNFLLKVSYNKSSPLVKILNTSLMTTYFDIFLDDVVGRIWPAGRVVDRPGL